MAMKETERSLRAYFLFAGVVAVLLALRDESEVSKLGAISLPLDKTLALYVPIVTRILLGIGFVVAGIKLKAALPGGAGWIKKLLVVSGAMLFVNGALITAAFGTDVGRSGIVGAAIGLAITIYLHRSVVRLAGEAAQREGIPPAPPPARAV